MAKYESKIITKKEIWEDFLLSQKPKTFLQSWNWGEVNELDGSKIFRIGYYKDKKLVGVSLIIKETAKRGPHLLVPAGPLIDWKDIKIVDLFIKTIWDYAVKEECWFVRVRPEILANEQNEALFSELGFISAPMHLHAENTWVLDINKSETELLAGMRKTTRYLIKKGEKSDLKVEISSDSKLSKVLFDLQEETAKRHKFVGFSEKLFKNEIEVFAKNNNANVFLCRYGKDILAIAIIVFYGDTAYYHFSGSVSGYKELPFSYFLQWEIIKEAKKRGIKHYNFWGIAPDNNPKHRFAGVTLFKTGFGGEKIDWLHAHDLVVSKKYWFTYFFETMRKIFRHL
jgi:lipid II:glycine glycyltransferase (peptidoglycan interpeptide bridge formation enzyme)